MGTDFNCGCRVSGGWYLCAKHEALLIAEITHDEMEEELKEKEKANSCIKKARA